MDDEIYPLEGNILIVDDNLNNLNLLINILKERGHRIRPVRDARLALSAISKEAPDLVLLDIIMPEMDGYEFCEHLKEDESTKHIPVIFLSALEEIVDKLRAFSVGGVDYITKPFHYQEVMARVETHLKLGYLEKMLAEKTARLQQAENENQDLKAQIDRMQKK